MSTDPEVSKDSHNSARDSNNSSRDSNDSPRDSNDSHRDSNVSLESVIVNLVKSVASPQVFGGVANEWFSGFFEKPDPGTEKSEWLRRVWLVFALLTLIMIFALAIMAVMNPTHIELKSLTR